MIKRNYLQCLWIALYCILLCSYLLFINLKFLEGIPHVPDDTAYFFMAKMFAQGTIISHIPIPTSFVDYLPVHLSVAKETWLFVYPFGHPLLLMLGMWIHFPNIIPPLIGTLSILFLFLIVKNLYNLKTAILLLPLPFLSPFFLENAASFMSHNTAAFYLIMSFYCLITYLKSGNKYLAMGAGVFLGLLFNTRPLNSLPFLFLESLVLIRKDHFGKKNSMYFLLGFAILFFAYFAYNDITNGSFFHFQYYAQTEGFFSINSNDLASFFITRWNNVVILFNNLGPMLYNLPAFGVYLLLLVPFLLRKALFWDRIFFIALFSLPIVYFFYNGTFIMYGPRFWYEILPFIFILTARSLGILWEKNSLLTSIAFSLCIYFSLAHWFGILPTQDPDYFSPLKVQELKGFNFTNDGIRQTLKQRNIKNAVIFVEDCSGNWWCYGSVFPLNSPNMDTPLVYVKDLGDSMNLTLKSYYPDRPFYRINYDTHEITKVK